MKPHPVTSLTYGSYAHLMSEAGQILYKDRHRATWSHEKRGKADAVVQRAVRKFYSPRPQGRDKYAHEWSFLRPVKTLTTRAEYNTGTVTISSGVVTGSGTTFASWMADGEMTHNGSLYTIASFTNTTTITLDDTTVTDATARSYSITQRIYDLPSDFVMLDGPLTYAYGETVLLDPIEVVGEWQIRQKYQDTLAFGRPVLAAVRAKDATSGFEIMLWPSPNAAYSIEYRSRINPSALSDSNTTPYGGAEHYHTIVAAVQAEAELENGEPAHFVELYDRQLSASISLDRKAQSPDTLGYNYDANDRAGVSWFGNYHERSDNLVTYSGYSP